MLGFLYKTVEGKFTTIKFLRSDKVSMLTHAYQHKPLRTIKVVIYNHQAESRCYFWPNVRSADFQVYKKYGHTWHQMSLLRPGVIKQHKPNQIVRRQKCQKATQNSSPTTIKPYTLCNPAHKWQNTYV